MSIFPAYSGIGLYRREVSYPPCMCVREKLVELMDSPNEIPWVEPVHAMSPILLEWYGEDNHLELKWTEPLEEYAALTNEIVVDCGMAVNVVRDAAHEYTRVICGITRKADEDVDIFQIPVGCDENTWLLYEELFGRGLRCRVLAGGSCNCGYCPMEVCLGHITYEDVYDKMLMLVNARRGTGVLLPPKLYSWMVNMSISDMTFRKCFDKYVFLDTSGSMAFQYSMRLVQKAYDLWRSKIVEQSVNKVKGRLKSTNTIFMGGADWALVCRTLFRKLNRKLYMQLAVPGVTLGWPQKVVGWVDEVPEVT